MLVNIQFIIFALSYRVLKYICQANLYDCGNWSFTLREERRLRVSEDRVLRRIFVRKGEEETGSTYCEYPIFFIEIQVWKYMICSFRGD
jgi:hypothetical protein